MALIQPAFLDCVAAVGYPSQSGGDTQWSATGFFYGQLLRARRGEEKQHRVFLITNRHVLEGHRRATIRLNPAADQAARCFDLELNSDGPNPTWAAHPDSRVDVA